MSTTFKKKKKKENQKSNIKSAQRPTSKLLFAVLPLPISKAGRHQPDPTTGQACSAVDSAGIQV